MMRTLIPFTFGALLRFTAAQEELSKFTTTGWLDFSLGQPHPLNWTFGNGRPVSVVLSDGTTLVCRC